MRYAGLLGAVLHKHLLPPAVCQPCPSRQCVQQCLDAMCCAAVHACVPLLLLNLWCYLVFACAGASC